MPPLPNPSLSSLRCLRSLIHTPRPLPRPFLSHRLTFPPSTAHPSRAFTTTPQPHTTLMQVLRAPRTPQRARHSVSPALVNRPHMKAVCLKVTVMKPKKPNSAERKVAKVRLSSGRAVTAYIPGEDVEIKVWDEEAEEGVLMESFLCCVLPG
ncbi:MAG: hypothetical protein LQ342_000891 [Letrouitia transgressa]|nr:MAG: hypothetical protein LQ342_000891 [Letrouitia transgressa]